MFFRLKKWQKLGFIGVAGFAVVLLLIFYSIGFFDRSLPTPCEGSDCPLPLLDESLTIQQLVIEDSSIAPKEIFIANGEIVALTVVNRDGVFHKLRWLKGDGNGFIKGEEVFVEPNKEIIINGFFAALPGFTGKKYNVSKVGTGNSVTGPFPVIELTHSYLIVCNTCIGENPQVKISLEE